jgi:hypothetical protein
MPDLFSNVCLILVQHNTMVHFLLASIMKLLCIVRLTLLAIQEDLSLRNQATNNTLKLRTEVLALSSRRQITRRCRI